MFFQHKSIMVGAIRNVMFGRILLVLVFSTCLPMWYGYIPVRRAALEGVHMA